MDEMTPHDQQKVEIVNEAEMILIHARQTARRMQERLWRVMNGHELDSPHQPARHEEGSEGENEQKHKGDEKENQWAS